MNDTPPPKKTSPEDWHPADLVARLRKAGWSMSRLALHHGYSNRQTLAVVSYRRWPKGERLVAEALGLHPRDIWPSRYPAAGSLAAAPVSASERRKNTTPLPGGNGYDAVLNSQMPAGRGRRRGSGA